MIDTEIQGAHDEVVRRWHRAAAQHTLGNMTSAVEGWADAMNYQRQMAIEAGFPIHTRYLPDVGWTVGLGHVAAIETFIKLRLLGMTETKFVILVDPERNINPTYLDLFRPYIDIRPRATFTDDIRLITDYLAVIEVNGQWMWFLDALGVVEQRWQAEGRPPLFTLPQEQIDAGRQRLGLAPTDWFVTLHIRKMGDAQNLRDIDEATYAAAIARIEAAGGKVFKVPSDDRGLDVFLLSQARFAVLGNSGPAWCAGTFGTPVLLANWVPVGIKFPYKGAIYLHKKLSRNGKLFAPEDYVEPFIHVVSEDVLTAYNVQSIPCTSEELLDGVERMLVQTGAI